LKSLELGDIAQALGNKSLLGLCFFPVFE